MAYTIVKSNGTVLTTIPDGTINTSSTSLGLPGRNYAGYGQTLDTNFVHQMENFAKNTPPANPLRGQLWYDTNSSTLKVCPTDGETNALAWSTLTSTTSGGNTTFGNITVTGNISADSITLQNNSNANAATFSYLTVTTTANIADANIATANIGTLRTTAITTGATTTNGSLTGTWTLNGTPAGNGLIVNTGNIYCNTFLRINPSNLYDLTGNQIVFSGTYSNANVQALMPVYGGNILASNVQTPILTTGSNATPGTITGIWSLSSGSRIQATYADLAERFEADDVYSPGTVVQLGGIKEITAVEQELSEVVFGVISDTAAYLMNATAGSDKTHPPVAVSGRVKVKVIGEIKKGDRLVSAGQGMARAGAIEELTAFNTIGRSLVDKSDEDEGIIEAFVMVK